MEILKENVEIILPENGLEEKLKQAEHEKRKLIIKLGFDPTAPDLHLGHAIVLKKLRQFQELGHKIIIVIGSFTAQIGDPTGKNKSRPPLSKEKISENAQTYVEQLSKLLDVSKCHIVHNSDWLSELAFQDVIKLLSKVTVAQIMHRADFNKRFQDNTPISMHEMIYPILQGYDSLKIKADIEMGGTDQLFNCTMGRQLQETEGLSGQTVICMPLLRGTDGNNKMSKSLNNCIGITDSPEEMYGKIMSIPDALLNEYLFRVTDFNKETKKDWEIRLQKGENPMLLKKAIAFNLIEQYHSQEMAIKASKHFEMQFQNKIFSEKEFIQISISNNELFQKSVLLIDLCKFINKNDSKSNLKRLIEGGGVIVNDKKITDAYESITLERPLKIKLGKRNFYEII